MRLLKKRGTSPQQFVEGEGRGCGDLFYQNHPLYFGFLPLLMLFGCTLFCQWEEHEGGKPRFPLGPAKTSLVVCFRSPIGIERNSPSLLFLYLYIFPSPALFRGRLGRTVLPPSGLPFSSSAIPLSPPCGRTFSSVFPSFYFSGPMLWLYVFQKKRSSF